MQQISKKMKKLFLFLLLASFAAQPAEAKKPKQSKVKNIIYMIGDGMGLTHVSMLELENKYAPTSFDRADNIALTRTYSANNRVTDSAASGTALATGYKTNNGTLGQLPDGTAIESIIAKAEKKNYATGLIATYAIQHATPAAFYAHVKSRGDYSNITKQFMESNIDIAFGGGIKHFEDVFKKMGKNHIEELEAKGYKVCKDWNEVAAQTEGQVLGLLSDDNMPAIEKRQPNFLADATGKALEILTNNVKREKRDGFVLMVEGSQIDGRSHGRDVAGILGEMRDFDKAVKVAMDYADEHPGTLVVVVADHETGGLSIPSSKTDFTLPESGIGYNFGTSSHTAALIPVYLYGAGAEQINGIMENTELSWKLQRLIGVAEK